MVLGKSQATDDGVDVSMTRVTYTYPMVKETDMTEGMKADVRYHFYNLNILIIGNIYRL